MSDEDYFSGDDGEPEVDDDYYGAVYEETTYDHTYHDNGAVYEKTTHETWCDRMCSSCGGLVIGILLVLGAMGGLFWNEGRALRRYKDLSECGTIVQSIQDISFVDKSLDDQLIHLAGMTAATQNRGNRSSLVPLVDSTFEFSANAIKMRREVEIYQWEEDTSTETTTRKNSDGSTTKTTRYEYSYHRTWRRGLIRSRNFHDSFGHRNPSYVLFGETFLEANRIYVGAYQCSSAIVQQRFNWWRDISRFELSRGLRNENNTISLPRARNGYVGSLRDKYIYYSRHASSRYTRVGDTRISFSIVPNAEVSIVARLDASGMLAPFYTSRGGSILLVERGSVDAVTMLNHAQNENRFITWLIRIVGALVMFFGYLLCFGPLTTLVDIIPFVGDLVQVGAALVSFFAALVLSSTIVAVAWLFYRPLLGGIVLAIIVGSVVGFMWCTSNKQNFYSNSNEYKNDNNNIVHAVAVTEQDHEQEYVVEPIKEATAIPAHSHPMPTAPSSESIPFSQALGKVSRYT